MIEGKNLLDNINISKESLKGIVDFSTESIFINNADGIKTNEKEDEDSLKKLVQIFDYKKEFNNIDLSLDNENIIRSLYFNKKTNLGTQNISSLNNDSLNINNIQNDICLNQNRKLFKAIIPHKRGRKPINNNISLKEYSGLTNDNLERKIQVNYITFLVSLANDVIKFILGKANKIIIKRIDYSIKRVIEYNHLQGLKKCSYFDILSMKISKRYKNCSENENRINLIKICNQSPLLRRFFEQNYLKIFQDYYYNNLKPLNHVIFEGLKITLSNKTKSFHYLIEKNEDNKIILIKLAKIAYFNKNPLNEFN